MGTRSTFRSTRIRTGRVDGTPGNAFWFPEKRLSLELRMWSRNFRSSLVAISSAGPPLGHRMIGIVPVWSIICSCYSSKQVVLTHCYTHTEQATNNFVNKSIQVLIGRLRAVEPIICIVSESQAEQVWLCHNKVEILVENLRNMLRCARVCYFRSKVF